MTLRSLEKFGVYLGLLLVSLVMLYGLSSLIIKFSPAPVSTWARALIKRSTPSGWAISA